MSYPLLFLTKQRTVEDACPYKINRCRDIGQSRTPVPTKQTAVGVVIILVPVVPFVLIWLFLLIFDENTNINERK